MTDFSAVTHHIDVAGQELAALTQRLYAGQLNLAQWEAAAAGVLKDAHLSASAAARGIDGMGSVEFGRVGGNLGDEFRWLSRFADDVAAGRVSEAQALARIQQYANASQQAYWSEFGRQAKVLTGLPRLDQVPCDGKTRCRGNCNCELTSDENGLHWNLRAGESCPDCMALAAGSPYRPGNL